MTPLRARLGEVIGFLVVGGLSAACSWLPLFLFVEALHLHYIVAFILTFLVVNTAAFYSNARIAFRGRGEGGHAALFRFYTVSGLSLVVNTLALKALVEGAGWWYLAAAVFLAGVNAPINYVLHRRLTYRLRDNLSQ